MSTILSIVPRLPPAVDGVGDYACLLADALVAQHRISTKFIACDPSQPIESQSGALGSVQLMTRSQDSLLDILDRCNDIDTLFLHYVGYGYAKRGCPFWLVAALSKWRRAKPSRRLMVMFHEVYASDDRPWNSQFWTSPLQRQIAKDLIELADVVMTSNQRFVNLIMGLSTKHHDRIAALPVFSTVGACAAPRPLSERKPWLVTFGNSGFRKSIYTNSLEQLTTVCQQLEISEIYDIGHSSIEIVRSIPGIKVNAMGILPATEISQIFSQARVGFINYPIPFIAKSTIFAAYSSHQLLSVFDRDNLGDNLDGVEIDRDYWVVRSDKSIDLQTAQLLASNAYRWYERHSLGAVTDLVAELLTQVSAG
jgi:hypothetical protein